MSFRASLSVFLGCQFGQANKLLNAAGQGQVQDVKEILQSKPQLAAYSGFHGTHAPLHLAASSGHLDTCTAIVDLLKQRIAAEELACRSSPKQRTSSIKRWRCLLTTVINQRTHRGYTPLMLACEAGHAAVVAFLLAEGADATAFDTFHCRNALHLAAMGGHADCVRVLCSDSTTVVVDGAPRALRDLISPDLQVQSAKFIDQRSFGGLTALHFAAVSGNLDTLQVLLQAGAATMGKTDGEAFIGEEYLTQGSTPLHVAVLVGSVPLAHALLQAHSELMTVATAGRDDRRRRPWEGHSRSDIRSVRNGQRKLPYHLARERGWTQLMQLVDPRVAVDVSLDAARDTEHGIGPKCLATICSMVLQKSLLQWLDECQAAMESAAQLEKAELVGGKKKGGAESSPSPPRAAATAAAGVPGSTRNSPEKQKQQTRRSWSLASLTSLMTPSQIAAIGVEQENANANPNANNTVEGDLEGPSSYISTGEGEMATPFATHTPPLTPRASVSEVSAPSVAVSAPEISSLSMGMERMDSLHAYVGMLSVRRPAPATAHHARRATLDGSALPTPVVRMVRACSAGSLQQLAAKTSGGVQSVEQSPSSISQQGPMRRALSSIRGRLLSGDLDGANGREGDAPARATCGDANVTITSEDGTCIITAGGKSSLDSDSTVCGSLCSDDGDTANSSALIDVECGVCLDNGVEVMFAGCEHALCLGCARNLTNQDKKPPSCPFCRRMVVGFSRVSTPCGKISVS